MTRAHALMPFLSLALVAGLGVTLGVSPKLREHRRAKAEVRGLMAELAKPIDAPGMIEEFSKNLGELRTVGASRMTPIPQESDIAGLVRNVSARLDELGLTQNELTTGQSVSLDDASSIPIALHVEGPFPKVLEVLRYIEDLPRLVRISRLAINNPAATRDPGTNELIEADMLLDVFYAPVERAKQAEAAP